MKDTDFLSMTTYVRVQEKKLLDRAAIDRVSDAANVRDALRLITQHSAYDFGALRRPEDYETVVKAELRGTYQMAYRIAANIPELPEILGCKYDYHNVKVALKAKYLGQEGGPYVEATPVEPSLIAKVVAKYDSKANLPLNLHAAIQAGSAAYERAENPQDIDIALDQLQYAHMLALAARIESAFITGYVRALIDFYNVRTLMRVKNMQKGTAFLAECLVPGGNADPAFFLQNYGKSGGALALAFAFKSFGGEVKAGVEAYEKSGNFAELERLLDNSLIHYVRGAKRISFGPEVLFAYLVSKENEIRQIRIVVACKQNQIPSEVLKERLRDNYA